MFPDDFDPSSSILFLGSGFSVDATNVLQENLPVGRGLNKKLLEAVRLPATSDHDLKDLATYAARNGVDIHKLLEDTFTVRQLTDDQRTILAAKWRRIYTTNYDDAVECFAKDTRAVPKLPSYSIEDSLPGKILAGTVVHLHGFIHRCTPANVLSQLVLSHSSYAEQAAKTSPWWAQFERDIRAAEAVFFVGYSLSDFKVASYLSRTPAWTSKCHFVLRPGVDAVMSSRIEEYGKLHSIGVAGFANSCRSLKPQSVVLDPKTLKAFRYFDPTKDNKAPTVATSVEIDALMTFGNFKLQRLLASFPDPTYVVPRNAAIAEAVRALEKNRTLITHSKIGNGKTIFRQCLSMQLTAAGYTCFECRDDVTLLEREIEYIKNVRKPVVVFPTYDTAYATLNQLTELPESARFIVEMNTSTLQVRRNEVYSHLVPPIARIDLNLLSSQDTANLHALLDKAGLPHPDIKSRSYGGVEMRDIVLSLYDNQAVSGRVRSLLAPALTDPDFKRVLYCSVILKSLNLKVDPGFLRMVTRVDAYEALSKFNESALEIMDFDLDRVEPHSALFSEYLIRNYVDAHDLTDWVYTLCAEAARRKNEDGNLQSTRSRDARHALGTLLTFSHLADFLNKRGDRDALIGDLYERCRGNIDINGEPLFWLQYSIFMQSQGKLDIAKKHMDAAYDRADRLPGFQTYQLDTNSLGLLLAIENANDKSPSVAHFEEISERIELLRDMLADGGHRGHALAVLAKVEEFVLRRRKALSNSEATRLTYQLRLLVDQLEGYSVALKAETGSDLTKVSLERAVQTLVRL